MNDDGNVHLSVERSVTVWDSGSGWPEKSNAGCSVSDHGIEFVLFCIEDDNSSMNAVK